MTCCFCLTSVRDMISNSRTPVPISCGNSFDNRVTYYKVIKSSVLSCGFFTMFSKILQIKNYHNSLKNNLNIPWWNTNNILTFKFGKRSIFSLLQYSSTHNLKCWTQTCHVIQLTQDRNSTNGCGVLQSLCSKLFISLNDKRFNFSSSYLVQENNKVPMIEYIYLWRGRWPQSLRCAMLKHRTASLDFRQVTTRVYRDKSWHIYTSVPQTQQLSPSHTKC